jgi:hypothetical protein
VKAAIYKRPLYIKRGDSYRSPVFRFYDLSVHGGPTDFTNTTISARLVKATGTSEVIVFGVEPVDLAERRVRLTLDAEEARNIPFSQGVWDLQVHDDETDWDGTPLQGTAEVVRQATDV